MESEYVINGIVYSKEQIMSSNDLQKELLIEKKKQYHREICRENAIIYRANNKEKINEANKKRFLNRYHSDEEYRKKVLEYHKNYRLKKLGDADKKKRGRKQIFQLNDNFELVRSA